MIEKFYAKIYKTGGSHVITIPSNLIKFAGLEIGEEVIVYIKKKDEKDEKL